MTETNDLYEQEIGTTVAEGQTNRGRGFIERAGAINCITSENLLCERLRKILTEHVKPLCMTEIHGGRQMSATDAIDRHFKKLGGPSADAWSAADAAAKDLMNTIAPDWTRKSAQAIYTKPGAKAQPWHMDAYSEGRALIMMLDGDGRGVARHDAEHARGGQRE